MRKIITFLFISLILSACSDKGEPAATVSDNTGSRAHTGLECFQIFGSIHNEILDKSIQAFSEDTPEVLALDLALDSLAEIECREISKSNLSANIKNQLKDKVHLHKNFIYNDNLKQKFVPASDLTFDPAKEDIDSASIYELIEYARTNEILESQECDILSIMSNLVYQNATGELTDELYISELATLIDRWNSHYGHKNYGDQVALLENNTLSISNNAGYLSGCVLSIAQFSANYWMEAANTDDPDYIAPWLLADAGGAVVGATFSGISSYLIDGKVDWADVGIGALGGAIDGSFQCSGRVTKWISKLFK